MTAVGEPPVPVRSPEHRVGVTEILVVCQANRCRSPFEAEILRLLADDSVRVHSGGLMAGGAPMPAAGVRAGELLGLDFSAHRSRELDRSDLRGFDLILTMARAQSREIVAADAALTDRTFTIRQFGRWIQAHVKSPHMSLDGWLATVAAQRSPDEFVGDDDADDIADPIAAPVARWIDMASELTELSERVAGALGARPA